jgi:hypothetical protein
MLDPDCALAEYALMNYGKRRSNMRMCSTGKLGLP